MTIFFCHEEPSVSNKTESILIYRNYEKHIDDREVEIVISFII
jgi:hypothetical protein